MSWRLVLLAVCGLCVVGDSPVAVGQEAKSPAPPAKVARQTPWTTSKLTGSLEPPAPYRVERAFPQLSFVNAVDLAAVPGRGRLALLELGGKLLTFPHAGAPAQADVAIELAKSVKGFSLAYGLAFHPQFAENGYCYLAYVLAAGLPDGTRVSRFKMSNTDPPVLDPASEQIIITWMSGGHNGCALQFGSDGCLYISTGDGGGSFPPDGNNTGQDISDLLASILRIDVDHPSAPAAYSIPKDNPFVDLPKARGEIWAYGLRNPWKISFDGPSGSLWVADVGWEMWEMIYRVERGGNYGWSLVEGSQPVHRERTPGPTPIIPPTVEHSHTEARSISGGHVYRGQRLPELVGSYVYGDFVTGKIWSLKHDGTRVVELKELVDTPLQVVCFGADGDGELYVVDHTTGLYHLVPNEQRATNADFPRTLSATGLFASVAGQQPAAGVVPYAVVAEPWADYATAQRYVALPGTTQLGVYKDENVQVGYIKGAWEFPSDGVLAKTLSLEMEAGNPASRRHVETQILHRDGDTWRAYAYAWNEAQTDADLVDAEGLDRTLIVADPAAPNGRREQTWHFASRTECILCHTTRAGSIHGFTLSQLNRPLAAPAQPENQLQAFAQLGLFAEPLPTEIRPMASPSDASADLEARMRAYLHVNCAHCHRRGGGGSAAMDIRHEFTLPQTNLLAARPTQGTFGLPAAAVLAPGDPYRSVLYYRMSKLGRGRMPQFGSNLVDTAGVRLLHDWIRQLPVPAADDQHPALAKLRLDEDQLVTQLAKADVAGGTWQAPADALLATTRGALRLLDAVEDQTLSTELKSVVVRRGAAQPDPQIRDLFERFLPASERVRRLGTAIRPDELLALTGDAERGKNLFAVSTGVVCRNCHRIQQVGIELGPDLTLIGRKSNRKQLLESMLEPSKAIEPKFQTHLVETTAGKVYAGLLVSRSDTELVLKDAQNKELKIPAGEIELAVPQRTSLMPDLLLKEMTAQEVADLLEYLAGLK